MLFSYFFFFCSCVFLGGFGGVITFFRVRSTWLRCVDDDDNDDDDGGDDVDDDDDDDDEDGEDGDGGDGDDAQKMNGLLSCGQKKIQYFARSYTGFYHDNIFPDGTTHETCEIKDCP